MEMTLVRTTNHINERIESKKDNTNEQPNATNWDQDEYKHKINNKSNGKLEHPEARERCVHCKSKLTLYERFFGECRCGRINLCRSDCDESSPKKDVVSPNGNRQKNLGSFVGLSTPLLDPSNGQENEPNQSKNDDIPSPTNVLEEKEQAIESNDCDQIKSYGRNSEQELCNHSSADNIVNEHSEIDRKCCLNGNPNDDHGKDCTYKNDFCYKQKRCDLSIDNRISFHNRQKCYQCGGKMFCDDGLTDSHTATDTNKAELTGDKEDYNPREKEHSLSLDRITESLYADDMTSDSHIFSFHDQIFKTAPKTVRDWLAYSAQIRIEALLKRKTGAVRRSKQGHDYVVVLDCSARMSGEKFDTMTQAVKYYINGIKRTMHGAARDNIGLAIFGEISTLLSPPTCDYDMLMTHIDNLQPQGQAPLFGGLVMGLAGALGTGSCTGIGGYEFNPFVIMFTDNRSQHISTEPCFGINSSYVTGQGYAELKAVISQMKDAGLRIYFVSLEENGRNEIMDFAIESTMGRMVKPNEMYRLIRMTQMLHLATSVASEVSFIRTRLTRDLVKENILQRTYNFNDPHEDCINMVMELVSDEMSSYAETNYRTLQIGDRVRRGPDWIFENQDSGLPGTVVKKKNSTSVYVEWDSGDYNYYFYDENMGKKSIRKVTEYRKVVDGMFAVGCRVERGNDWTYDDEDGGCGSQGTILSVRDNGSVVVRWDCRKTRFYKIGMDGLLEVQLCDAPQSTMGYRRTVNPDIVNEDDIRQEECILSSNAAFGHENGLGNKDNNGEDVKFNKYIIPIKPQTNAKPVWEYKDEQKWKGFSNDINTQLENCYSKNPNGRLLLEINSFSIDLHKMKKIHQRTREEMDIRRRLSDC